MNTWNKTGSVLLDYSAAWETHQIQDGSVIYENGITYLFYCAGAPDGIGYASTTTYPTGWSKYASNPLFSKDAGEVNIAAPRVFKMPDGSWRMYYHAYDGTHDQGRIATATAQGFPNTWTKIPGVFFTDSASGFDSVMVQTQAIVPSWLSPDGKWHVLYGGYNGSQWRGGHAYSDDGLTGWTRDDAHNPVLDLGAGGAWDSWASLPLSIAKIGSIYYLIYQGIDASYATDPWPAHKWKLGYATSTDLVTWTKYSGNPILSPTTGTAWDSESTEGAFIYFNPQKGILDLHYVGCNVDPWTGYYKWGMARGVLSVFGNMTSGSGGNASTGPNGNISMGGL